MLDDLKFIHQKDPKDALGVAEKERQQLAYKYDVDLSGIKKDTINNVVLGGMGGSAWPALFPQSWPGLNRPFEIVRNYSLPNYVDDKTLYIASSYSGNTEEAIAALGDAENRGAQIVVTAAGGQLVDIAGQKNFPLFKIPPGIQPRMSSLYFFAAFVQLFEPLGIVEAGSSKELAAASDWLKDKVGPWRPDSATKDNRAKQLAEEIAGKSAIIYSGPLLAPAANKWKICFNENAKNLAWWAQYPEFNHNEFISWSSHPLNKPFTVIEIQSDLEAERVKKRFDLSQKLLSGKRPMPVVVKPEGKTVLEQLVWAAVLGDFTSIYLALLNGVDPTPVDLVEKFKTELDK